MKTAIVTTCFGKDHLKILQLSKPLFEHYCNKIGADFIVINTKQINIHKEHLEKFQCKDFFKSEYNPDGYDRIVLCDNDILIHPNAPNIFDEVPFQQIGAVYDNIKNDEFDKLRHNEILQSQIDLGNINWETGYVNSGVLVLSHIHKNIFNNPEYRLTMDSKFQDQTLLNYNIKKYNHQIYKLDSKFNGMQIVGYTSQDKNKKTGRIGFNKTDAFFMHFAGEDPKFKGMLKTIQMGIKLQLLPKGLIKEFQETLPEYFDIIRPKSKFVTKLKQRDSSRYKPLLFFDFGELGWSMYLSAHIDYLNTQKQESNIICFPERDVLFRNKVKQIHRFPQTFIDKYISKYEQDGWHLYDPQTNTPIKDVQKFHDHLNGYFYKYDICCNYGKFKGQRLFKKYIHSPTSRAIINEQFSDKRCIIVFPRYRNHKFGSRNISANVWEDMIEYLCKKYPKYNIINIGRSDKSYEFKLPYNNYTDLTTYDDDLTLDILVGLCNMNRAIVAIGSQSALVKISLLHEIPSYIIGNQLYRHAYDENWNKTPVMFHKVDFDNDMTGFNIPDHKLLFNEINIFINHISIHQQHMYSCHRYRNMKDD